VTKPVDATRSWGSYQKRYNEVEGVAEEPIDIIVNVPFDTDC
jgi:hypothetical protein